jgi:uncharacterized membrane protein (DUF373 family)
MRHVAEQIQLVAPTRSTVLITGESGTGKELVARALHRLSPRKDGPFVVLNCAAIPKDLAESDTSSTSTCPRYGSGGRTSRCWWPRSCNNSTGSTAGETGPNRSGRPDAPGPVPHTQVHSPVRRTLENLQDVIAFLLMGLLLVLSLQALWRLARMALLEAAATPQVLSEIVFVLILTELYRLLIFYLREHRISVALMVEVALVSILREVMLEGAHEYEWPRLLGLSLFLTVLGGLLARGGQSRQSHSPP